MMKKEERRREENESMNGENETHHEPDANSSAAALLFSSHRITVGHTGFWNTDSYAGRRRTKGNQALRGCDSTGAVG